MLLVFLQYEYVFAQKPKSFSQKHMSSESKHRGIDTSKRWGYDTEFGINFSQSYALNSASSTATYFGLNFTGSGNASYNIGKFSCLAFGDYEIGYFKDNKRKFIKSNDMLMFSSDIGIHIRKNAMVGILTDFQTQSLPAYEFPENDSVMISKFMSPAYLTVGAGFSFYHTRKFVVFISPAAAHVIFVGKGLPDYINYGVPNNQRKFSTMGGFIKINYDAAIVKNVHLRSSLEVYLNYLKKPHNLDLYWPSTIQFRINKYLSANINVNVRYNQNTKLPIYKTIDNIKTEVGRGTRVQINELMGIGFMF